MAESQPPPLPDGVLTGRQPDAPLLPYFYVLVLLCIVLVWASWLFRYDVQARSADDYIKATRLDRWTGETSILASGVEAKWRKVRE